MQRMYALSSVVSFILLGAVVCATLIPSPDTNSPFLVVAGLGVPTYPANLFTCTQTNCVGCTSWDLEGRNEGSCYFAGQFISVTIQQPSNAGLPYSVDIAPGNCTDWLSIPTVNTCYNINGAVFEQFALDS
ncbi:hypothetical protein C8Q73DRAFT_668317 [Cubamyces lactineus]|nr:hypothetical protein C8Q73DRAFT_668317 [Cubamyces lactineus]